MECGNEISVGTERVYARLKGFSERARFRSGVLADNKLPPLPKRTGGGPPDYLAILQDHAAVNVDKRLSKGGMVLTRCPLCGREAGHAMLTGGGLLKCKADSCDASGDGLQGAGGQGLVRSPGHPLLGSGR